MSAPPLDPTDLLRRREIVFERIADVKRKRTDLLTGVKSGDVEFSAIFDRAAADPDLQTMKLLPLIEALPGSGKVQSRRALGVLGVEETVTIADLDPDQRADLLGLLVGERLTSADVTGATT